MTQTPTATRTETDSIGPIEVPAHAYWGAQTERSLENFPFGAREQMPIGIVHALAIVKKAAARINRGHGLAADKADAIEAAAQEVIDGRHDDQFPLVIWQTGSGTQSNMNANEVIAGRANEILTGTRGGKSPVHPNDDVNRGQSSNDTFPTALHVAAALAVTRQLYPALDRLHAALDAKAKEWDSIVKIGRTHLQDATPLTLGQEFSGYVQQLANARARIEGTLHRNILPLAQGGTAVGTGLNAPHGFAEAIAAEIAEATGLDFVTAPNKFEALASNDGLVDLHGTLNVLAVALTKIANDIRLLGSGPRSGLGELELPANEPGSSIMPGKVNPVIPEATVMVCAQVIGHHTAITVAGQTGNFQLNVTLPLIAANLLDGINLLANITRLLADTAIAGLKVREDRVREALDRNPILVTALNPIIGYEKAAAIAKRAYKEQRPVLDVAKEDSGLSDAELRRLLDPAALTAGGIHGGGGGGG